MTNPDRAVTLPRDVLERADMRAALTRHDFGTVFAIARRWAGISYSRLGEACGIKPERVGSLARGEGSITSFEKIAKIADELGIPGRMVGLAPRLWELGSPAPESTKVSPDAIWDGGILLRRDVLKTAAAGLGTMIGLPLVANGHRVGSRVPAMLRRRSADLRQLDNVLGGGDTLVIYLREYQATRALLKDGLYSEHIGKQLLTVLAEQAQQAGWAAFDSGDQFSATRLYEASKHAAREGGDKLLEGNAYAFLAYQQIESDPVSAVQLATASCDAAGDTAVGSAGALLHERRAWAHAIAGNAKDTADALDQARDAVAKRATEPQPDWSAWVDDTELRIMTGRCWTELKRPLRAVPVLEAVLGEFTDSYARDKALYSTWLAKSYLDAGEIEQAAATADRILDLCAGVASVRPRQQLVGVLTQLNEHRDQPEVAAVLEKARG
jgi:transcriptional regulator with XRE-family HTH domain/tetratricopeptide (TPR) repeat protein